MTIAAATGPTVRPPHFAVLLAKWTRTPDQPEREAARLCGHLADVTAIADELAIDWGAEALISVGLDLQTWLPRLRQALPRAAFLHDFGKANDHFQRMIRRPGAVTQAFRHEAISVWAALSFPRFRDWLWAK
jgi:CRISPR-associated endonuclease/helicase Cas3